MHKATKEDNIRISQISFHDIDRWPHERKEFTTCRVGQARAYYQMIKTLNREKEAFRITFSLYTLHWQTYNNIMAYEYFLLTRISCLGI